VRKPAPAIASIELIGRADRLFGSPVTCSLTCFHAAPRDLCWICGHDFQGRSGGNGNPRQKTRDHIYPQGSPGPGWREVSGIIVTKPACAFCNVARGAANHCVGMLACAAHVADDLDIGLFPLLAKWVSAKRRPTVIARRRAYA